MPHIEGLFFELDGLVTDEINFNNPERFDRNFTTLYDWVMSIFILGILSLVQ